MEAGEEKMRSAISPFSLIEIYIGRPVSCLLAPLNSSTAVLSSKPIS